jgi:mRNA interferase MazF
MAVAMIESCGIYSANLNPNKHQEIGKIRPVIVLTSQEFICLYPLVFVCPLSSKSFGVKFHVKISKRQGLNNDSYALIEHMRAISINRLSEELIAKITFEEKASIIENLNAMLS